MSWEVYIRPVSIVLIGAVIGWLTNYVAVKMLFRPHRPVFFGLIQGLIPKRRRELAENIGDVIAKNLISSQDIREKLADKDLEREMARQIDEILDKRMKDIFARHFRMLQPLMVPEVMKKIRIKIRDEILSHKDSLIEAMLSHVDIAGNLKDIIAKNVDSFSLDELETMTWTLTSRELKSIELIGAVLGAVIGFFQYLISIYW